MKKLRQNLENLEPYSEDGTKVNVIIESPGMCHYKFDYDVKTGCFKLSKELQTGMVFPFDFGFIPGTKATDGDPLDIMVLMEKPLFPGCLVECSVLGVIEIMDYPPKGKPIRYAYSYIYNLDNRSMRKNNIPYKGIKQNPNMYLK